MALSALIQWEVRPTNGTANAGGGFKVGASGTDYSQQNAAQVAYTDLVIGSTTTNLTSALNPFAAAHVGNVIAITGGTGFTAGFYEVVSVAAEVATMDRSVGTAASTGGTGNLGGARSGYSVGTTTLQASLVAGQKVWIKNEAWNEAVVLSVTGAAGAPILHEGYNTARGDAPTGANRPQNNRAAAAGLGIDIGAPQQRLAHLRVTAAGSDGIRVNNVNRIALENVQSYSNTSDGIDIVGGSGETTLIGCEFDNNSALGVNVSGAGAATFKSCYIHDNSTNGLSSGVAGAAPNLDFTIIEANAADAVTHVSTNLRLQNCTIDGNTGAATDGIAGTTPALVICLGTIFSNNGNYGANYTDGDSAWTDYNNFYGNATGARNNFPTGPNDQAVDPGFVDRANGNFAIGTALKALGYPGIFPGGLSTGYLDIGAVQRQEGAGSGGLRTRPRHNLVTDGVLT